MQELSAIAGEKKTDGNAVPSHMRAAVYRGANVMALESVPVPETGDDEILVRIHACGVCGTDLKKIELGLVPPPRIFGHEMVGIVVRSGKSVSKFRPGDRVAVYHHVPCRDCFYCRKRLYSQCACYRRTGTTAGFEPAGGGFASYVRVMNWIVASGTILVPDDVPFEEASFLEPLNTCLKALETSQLEAGEVVVIYGQGPVGLLLMQAATRIWGAQVIGLDFIRKRLDLAMQLGAGLALNPARDDVRAAVMERTEGRGADLAIVATADPRAVASAQEIARRGGRVMLFANTVPGEVVPVDVARICVEEKKLIGSYSSSVELQDLAAELVFTRKIDVARLISHRLPLERFAEAIHIASHPSEDSLKVIVQP
jgi:L-iditol 2-dehydrogenase